MIITKDIKYIGVNDHEIDLFEGQYEVPVVWRTIPMPSQMKKLP